jgi:hypothetical protein
MHHITKSPPKFKQPEGACVLQEKIEFRGLGYVAEGEKTVRMISLPWIRIPLTAQCVCFNEHNEIVSWTTPGIRQKEGRVL